jgi:hypothetical protein
MVIKKVIANITLKTLISFKKSYEKMRPAERKAQVPMPHIFSIEWIMSSYQYKKKNDGR